MPNVLGTLGEGSRSSESGGRHDQGLKSLPESPYLGREREIGDTMRDISPMKTSQSTPEQDQPRRATQSISINRPAPLDSSTSKQGFREPLPSPGRWALGGATSLLSPSHHGRGLGWRSMFHSRMNEDASGTDVKVGSQFAKSHSPTPTSCPEGLPDAKKELQSPSFYDWWSGSS